MDSNLVFRTVYVDHYVDAALWAQAAREAVVKSEMCRRYMQAGMWRIVRERLQVPPADDTRLSMRNVYLPISFDDELRGTAWNLKTTRTQLMRHALRIGMEAMQSRSLAEALVSIPRRGEDSARASGESRAKTRRFAAQRRRTNARYFSLSTKNTL